MYGDRASLLLGEAAWWVRHSLGAESPQLSLWTQGSAASPAHPRAFFPQSFLNETLARGLGEGVLGVIQDLPFSSGLRGASWL